MALVLLLRLPFLNQAVQGDDVYYLAGAEHALIDPSHPNHARYVFMGETVDMRGHPHPPANAWFLAFLLAVFDVVREAPFHAAYILFSLIAAVSMLSLARRFTERPVMATLLFLVTPAFVINGTSFESDLPFLAFWMASIALFVKAVDGMSRSVLAACVLSSAIAVMFAYQALMLAFILAIYLYLNRRTWALAWFAILAGPLTLGLWQLYERASTGQLPAAVLAGYMHNYGLQRFTQKVTNAVALTVHTAWILFPIAAIAAFWKTRRWVWILVVLAGVAGAAWDLNPLFWISLSTGLVVLTWSLLQLREASGRDVKFLSAWVIVFFGSALILFFAGSARYLLPMAAPICLLAARQLSSRWIIAAVATQLLLSLSLARVNYEHWDGYRELAKSLAREAQTKRVWINGEWGLRYYLELEGGLAMKQSESAHPGELVVSSALAYPLHFFTGGGMAVPLIQREIRPALPLRLIALNGHSAYSTATLSALHPFEFSHGPIDQVRAEIIVEKRPVLEDLPMNAPEADQQIVSGLYNLESGSWRWTSGKALVLLKSPRKAAPLQVVFNIPEASPARRISVWLDDDLVMDQTYKSPGSYTLSMPPVQPRGESAAISVIVDKSFSVPGDNRTLGIILTRVGFAGESLRR